VCFRFEAVLGDGDSIGSGGKIREHERAVCFGISSNLEVGRDIDRFHGGIGYDSSRRITHRAGDGTERLLGGRNLDHEGERECADEKAAQGLRRTDEDIEAGESQGKTSCSWVLNNKGFL
jgi:hypothetical protein